MTDRDCTQARTSYYIHQDGEGAANFHVPLSLSRAHWRTRRTDPEGTGGRGRAAGYTARKSLCASIPVS